MPKPNSVVFILLSGIVFGLCGKVTSQVAKVDFRQTFQPISTDASLRGLSVVSESIAWASGADGTVLRTMDGQNWKTVSVADAPKVDFRDIEAFDANTAVVLSAGSPALIYRTTDGGDSWKKVYENDHPKIFFDAMAFWNDRRGIAMSDPIDGRFFFLKTDDGGATWRELPKAQRPVALDGEAAFAASGTCLAVAGEKHVWLGLGGATELGTARVLRSSDAGETWESSTMAIDATESAGIFSLVFQDGRKGFAFGGDYKNPTAANSCFARTTDGGKTWVADRGSISGFRAGAGFGFQGKQKFLVAVGRNGGDYSLDGGISWNKIAAPRNHAIQFAPDSRIGWSVGAGTVTKWTAALDEKR